jgi:hypothetical protein
MKRNAQQRDKAMQDNLPMPPPLPVLLFCYSIIFNYVDSSIL